MDEDDFEWAANEKNILSLLNIINDFNENFRFENPYLRQLSHFSEMQSDTLMHREGSKG